jgi:hypothetical protein
MKFEEVEITKTETGIMIKGSYDQINDWEPRIFIPNEMVKYFLDEVKKEAGI